jgi:hypothetical protein
VNRRCSRKLYIIQNELWARIYRHPLKRCRTPAIVYALQSQEASQDQNMLALCRLKPDSSLSSEIKGDRMRKQVGHLLLAGKWFH